MCAEMAWLLSLTITMVSKRGWFDEKVPHPRFGPLPLRCSARSVELLFQIDELRTVLTVRHNPPLILAT